MLFTIGLPYLFLILAVTKDKISQTLPVNWWIFSFIPMLFTVLIWFVKYYLRDFYRVSVNYPILLTVYALINVILTEYRTKAEKIGLSYQINVKMPDTLDFDEADFCVMLSNLLENSLDAAKSYMMVDIRHLNRQLLLKIENDYSGTLKKDADSSYLTTKPHGSGLGLRSVNAILKDNHGFLKIDDKNGVFQVFAALNN